MKERVCNLLPTDDAYISFLNEKIRIMKENMEFWGERINWEYIKEKNDYTNVEIIAYYHNDVIRGICFVSPAEDSFVFMPSEFKFSPWIEMDWDVRKGIHVVLQYLIKHYPKILLEWDMGFDEMKEIGFQESSMKFEKGEYLLDYHSLPFIYGESLTFVKECYEEYYGRGEFIELTTTVMTTQELESEIYNKNGYSTIPCYQKHSNQTAFLGFHYFNPNEFRHYADKLPLNFIVVHVRERKRNSVITKLVGVMELCKNEEMIPYQCISFVDVHFDYRRMGVATKLYETLNDWLSPDDILVSTSPSEEGRAANIQNIRKRIVTTCKMFDNERMFRDAMLV